MTDHTQTVRDLLAADPKTPCRAVAKELGIAPSKAHKIMTLVKAELGLARPRGEKRTLPLDQIRTDGGTQPRAALDRDAIERYTRAYADGRELPPPVVFHDPETAYADGLYWLADGFHRHQAALAAGLRELVCEVIRGTQADAILYSCGANTDHGLPRSQADAERAVETVLSNPEWAQWSNRKVAEVCGLSLNHGTMLVGTVRERLSGTRVRESVRTAGAAVPKTARARPQPDAPGEPAEDVEARPEPDAPAGPEPDADELYLNALPLSHSLTGRALGIFRRDALYHRDVLPLLDQLKAKGGRDGGKVGTVQGAYQFKVDQLLRTPFPPAWLKCGRDGCVEGQTPQGPCPGCHGRGYVIP